MSGPAQCRPRRDGRARIVHVLANRMPFLRARLRSRPAMAFGWVGGSLGALALASTGGVQATGWTTFGGNAQHTGVSATAAQPLEAIRWSTPVDLSPPGNLVHYGSPLITPANTLII